MTMCCALAARRSEALSPPFACAPPCRVSNEPVGALRAVVIFVYVFMLGPILITAAVSFNESNRSQFPPRGFSLQWWGRALSPEWVDPLWFSLKLGTITALISTLLALPLAFALARHRFPGREAMVGAHPRAR